MSTVADLVIERIASQGIKHIFFLPGGGCMYLVDALARSRELEGVALLHEQSVGIAAEAYGQFTNSLSACIVTTGPGASNAITACGAAWTDSTPVLFISGQVKSSDDARQFGVRQYGFQELPVVDMVRAITKKAVKLENSEAVHQVLDDLVSTALEGRPGPVWLDIPLDIQNKAANSSTSVEVKHTGRKNQFSPSLEIESSVDLMVRAWEEARRPLLLVGNGVRLANESERVRNLIERTNTLSLLTWKMIDFLDESDPLNAGRPGSVGQRHANILQQSCDFILCLGARLDLGQVAYRPDNFAPKAKKFICEVDPAELSKLPESFSKINLHLSDFLDLLLPRIHHLEAISMVRSPWKSKATLLKEQLQPAFPLPTIDGEGVNLYRFMNMFSAALHSDDILVPGSSGACSEIVMQAHEVKLGQRVLNSEGLGPMGFGLPAAIGVAFANQGKRIFSIDGDGGFLMNLQELITAKYHNLPLIIFLLNNDGYGSIKSTQKAYFDGRLFGTDPLHGLGLPSWKSLIEGFGIDFLSLKTLEECRQLFGRLESLPTPIVIEVMVSKDQRTEPRVATKRMVDGSLLTDDMADMTPKLSDEYLTKIQDFLES